MPTAIVATRACAMMSLTLAVPSTSSLHQFPPPVPSANSLSATSLSTNSLPTNSLSTNSLPTNSLSTNSLSTTSFSTNSLSTRLPSTKLHTWPRPPPPPLHFFPPDHLGENRPHSPGGWGSGVGSHLRC